MSDARALRQGFLLTILALGSCCGPALGVGVQTRPAADGATPDELRVTARLDEMRRQRDAYEAGQRVEKAVRLELVGRAEEAEKLYAEAVELDPTNERAIKGLRASRDRLGLVTERMSLIERAEKEQRAKRQEILFRFDSAIAEARRGIDTARREGFQAARLQLDRAKLIRESSGGVFSPAELDQIDARLGRQDAELTAAIRRVDDAARRAQQRDWARRIKAARVHDKSLDL
jgi:tetratricopeptide (TPR) repeat protein